MIKVKDDIRKMEAERLISITSIYDGKDNTLYYHFSSDKKPAITEFKVGVPAKEKVESLIELFGNAALLEAEVTELFGVKFEGNPLSGKRLFQPEGNKSPPMCEVKKDA